MVKQAKIEEIKELIGKLSIDKFSGTLEISFNSGGISAVKKHETIHFEEAKHM